MAMTRSGYVPIFANEMFGNPYGRKLVAENYLRQSGQKYNIIRPASLMGHRESEDFKVKDEEIKVL